MEFFDCNASYGIDAGAEDLRPIPTVEALRCELDRAEVAKAVVWRSDQQRGDVAEANDALADDVRRSDHLYGTWAIVPSHTREIPGPTEMPEAMKANSIIGWRLFPAKGRFLPRAFVLRDWLEVAVARRIPVFVNTDHGATLEQVADLMHAFPVLTLVLTLADAWPSDRLTRPLVSEFPNLYLDTTFAITDGGLESFVGEYGARRLLYGSGLPHSYLGANMLMIRHAQIAEEDRALIAGGNLQRVLGEVSL
jgi:predicted TIM-barrel fold metal-dependent hydrolase